MYNAREANEFATKMKNENTVNYVVRQLEKWIKEAAAKGKFSIDIDGDIEGAVMYRDYGFCIAKARYDDEKEVKKIIEEAGYTVEGYVNGGWPHTVIKW